MDNNKISEIEYVATDVAAILYESSLKALEATLRKFEIPSRFYTILGIRDDSSCLIYRNGEWVTFYYERGQETGESHFSDIDDAAIELLYSVAVSVNEQENMKEYYLSEVKKRSKKMPSSKELYESIKNGFERFSKAVAV